MTKPNFFIVGAPKCGTTALYSYLSSHPSIFMSTPKEPHYFADDLDGYRSVSTLDDYKALFQQTTSNHLAVGEASVFYLCSVSAIENIYNFSPDSLIIAMFRNPVDMIYSFHSQLLYNFDEDEPDFEKAWHLQSVRQQGNQIPPRCSFPGFLQYKNMGSLGSQAERLLKHFPHDQIKLILFDDFIRDTRAVYEEVLTFLGVPSDNRETFPRINENKGHRSEAFGYWLRKPPLQIMALKQKLGIKGTGFGRVLLNINAEQKERYPLSAVFRRELVNEFYEEVEKLSDVMKRDLSHWHK